jgi:hypothetical protein
MGIPNTYHQDDVDHFSKKAINLQKVDDLLQSALSSSPDALFAETEASLT